MKGYRARFDADRAKAEPGQAFRALPLAAALVFLLCRCGGGPRNDFGGQSRSMLLTSGPTEIALSSAKVPGYWAKQTGDGQEFFLSTQVRSYEKGQRVRVEGPFGFAYPATFRDETGVYLSAFYQHQATMVIVVWKMAEEEGPEADR